MSAAPSTKRRGSHRACDVLPKLLADFKRAGIPAAQVYRHLGYRISYLLSAARQKEAIGPPFLEAAHALLVAHMAGCLPEPPPTSAPAIPLWRQAARKAAATPVPNRPWRWASLDRYVAQVHGAGVYPVGIHQGALMAAADRIEGERLHPALTGRLLPGLDADMLRELAADTDVLVREELHQALMTFNAAADRIAAPLPVVAVPDPRLDIGGAQAMGWMPRLHGVIPPGADIIKLRPNQDPARMRGKAPGAPTDATGAHWQPVSWRPDAEGRWQPRTRSILSYIVQVGGNIGLALGDATGRGPGADAVNLAALDLDTLAPITDALMPIARQFILERTGLDAAHRFGRVGRSMLIFRTAVPMTKTDVIFDDGTKESQKIEFLGQGQQVVIDGKHPSGTPYRMLPALHSIKPDALPELTVDEVGELLQLLAEAAVAQGLAIKQAARAAPAAVGLQDVPNRDHLVGDIAEVRDLLKMMPTPDDRHTWVKDLAALKGATLNDPAEGRALALDWSWHDSEAELDETAAVWNSLVPRTGIRDLRRYAGRPSELPTFTAMPPALPPAAPAASAQVTQQVVDPFQAQQGAADATARRACGAEFLAKLDTGAITAMAKASFHQNAPAPDVLVYPLLVRGHLSVLAGDGGTMKSMVALGMAYEIASGVPFISGDAVRVHHRGRVIFMTAEENDADIAWRRDKWRERARAMTNGGTDYLAQLFDGLDNAIIVSTSTETVDLFKSSGATEAMTELEALCRRTPGLDALIIDPAGSYSTADMKTEEFGGFVMALRAIAARQRIAILLLHHVSKAAINQASGTGEDLTQHATLGSVMTINSARVGAVVQRMTKRVAQQWSVPEDEAHNFVGILAPKANGIPVMMEPAWYRNDGGVPIPVTLAHLDKVTIKQVTAELTQQARTARMRTALLEWIEVEYKAKEAPSKTVLAGVLASRIGIGDKAVLAFLNSELSRGTLILDDSIKASNRAHGGVRPGDVERLKREVRQGPVLPGDAASLFGTD